MVLHFVYENEYKQKPSHEVKRSGCRAQRHDCMEAQIWGRQKKEIKNPAALKVYMSIVAFNGV